MTIRSILTTATALAALSLGAAAPVRAQTVLTDSNGIIRESLCVGLDCNVGIAFSFDTVILKEQNLRILFDDTSTAASFPTNDWRLTANDSNSGGANKFTIEDVTAGRNVFTILAGAPNNALFVNDLGKLGLGTSTPAQDIDIKTGNTPTIRLQQDASNGFSAQTWDIAGNESNFFIRDTTAFGNLPFRIRPGAPTSSIDIAPDGDVFMGLESANNATYIGDLVVGGPGVKLLDVVSTNNNAAQFRMITNSGNRRFVGLNAAGSVETQMVFGNSAIQLAGATNTTNLWATINAAGIALPSGASFSVNAVNLAVPDYVFAEDYKLMPLEQLGAFVAANKHLPNVPSAAEIQSTSLNMTAMQMTLLEKVEELTLYTLEQHKLLQEQRVNMLEQQKTIDILTQRLNTLTD